MKLQDICPRKGDVALARDHAQRLCGVLLGRHHGLLNVVAMRRLPWRQFRRLVFAIRGFARLLTIFARQSHWQCAKHILAVLLLAVQQNRIVITVVRWRRNANHGGLVHTDQRQDRAEHDFLWDERGLFEHDDIGILTTKTCSAHTYTRKRETETKERSNHAPRPLDT